MSIYAMSDEAVCRFVFERIEQIRLEQNLSQEDLSSEIGVTPKTYRNLASGKGRFNTIVAALRCLGRLELVDSFIPQEPFSPIELAKLQGKRRQRAGSTRLTHSSARQQDGGALDW